ncbi:MAG: FAD-dependent oxidoreductase [Gammaproteobacteria bacterium]|nr:FAD-dependent oxidoreductase [Gammaproteobacteria bacterium]
MAVLDPGVARFVGEVPVVVVGAGGCGLSAALAARQGGAEVLVLESDATPLGTTGMSTGLIPGAGSRFQRQAGIDDSPAQFAADIMRKTKGHTDERIALALAEASAGTVEWLVDAHDIPLSLVDTFLYPGHSAMRMHGTPNRSGAELMHALLNAAERSGVDILTAARVTDLFATDDKTVAGVRITRPDGSAEDLACRALILACCGFAGNAGMVAELMPEAVAAEFYGHPGNKGDAIDWGRALGAGLADLGGFQGHAGLAKGYGVPILWPVIVEGGIQVNRDGLRFADESRGYSEQTLDVLAQPGHIAFTVYDQRLHELMQEFDDYRAAQAAGAIRRGETLADLCAATGLPEAALAATLDAVARAVAGAQPDTFARQFNSRQPLTAPYYAVKVTGALFHTQGGLVVDTDGRVLTTDRQRFPNLYAGGGAARGISGPSCWGYIAGNGLLTATSFGRLAGAAAAGLVA